MMDLLLFKIKKAVKINFSTTFRKKKAAGRVCPRLRAG